MCTSATAGWLKGMSVEMRTLDSSTIQNSTSRSYTLMSTFNIVIKAELNPRCCNSTFSVDWIRRKGRTRWSEHAVVLVLDLVNLLCGVDDLFD